MQQPTKASRVLTLPLLPYDYTSTIEVVDNKFVVLTRKKDKNNFDKTNVIDIPESTVSPISKILSKNLLPISSMMYAFLTSQEIIKCHTANNFYVLLKRYLTSTFIDNPAINSNPYNPKINFKNIICNPMDLDKTNIKSTIFVYIPEDITNILSNTIDNLSNSSNELYPFFLPLFDYLKNTYFTKDRIEYCYDNIYQNISDGTLLPPIIPIFSSIFFDYLQNFSFTFTFTSSSNKNKEYVSTHLNVLHNKFSIISYNENPIIDLKELYSNNVKFTCITNPTIGHNLRGSNICYINYHSINDILDKLSNTNVAISTHSLLDFNTSDDFINKDYVLSTKILKQSADSSVLPGHKKYIYTKSIKLLVDLETVSIELPKVVPSISNSTTFNRLLNTVVIKDTVINSQIRCKSFSKLTSYEKHNSILKRFNTLYVHCYDSIKANLDKIGLTHTVLKRNNNVNQSYPLVESVKVNRQESFFINNDTNKRDLFEDLILGLQARSEHKSPQLDTQTINKENHINFEKIFYDSTGRRTFGEDVLLNNSYAIFQKYITNILPPLNFTCVHKDSDYQSLATKIITLKMYEFYIYSYTAFNLFCFNQRELKLVNSPDFPKISPVTDSNITTVRNPLGTIDEEITLHCYFFYIPRTIALDIASKVSLDMINSYNFLPITVHNSIPPITIGTATSTTNTTATTPTTLADDTTKELNNNNESIINGMGVFCTDTIKDLASIIENHSKKLSLDNKGSNDIF
jgi:hypothetical protein